MKGLEFGSTRCAGCHISVSLFSLPHASLSFVCLYCRLDDIRTVYYSNGLKRHIVMKANHRK
jgi:hypothetical protein